MLRVFALVAYSLIASTCFASEPHPWQIGLQAAASPVMEEFHWLHHFLMMIVSGVVIFVLLLLAYVCFRFSAKRNPVPATFSHNTLIEVIWTVIPIILLVIIAIPSFKILSTVEHAPPPELTIKVVGKQWYWTYEYDNIGDKHASFQFDSYIIPIKDLKPGQRRLLEVDNRMVVPQDTVIKLLLTSADVIHSFALPSAGLKLDAVPGRINSTWFKIAKKGVYYGQCSELCGVNHGFMPIAVEVVSKEDFQKWTDAMGKR